MRENFKLGHYQKQEAGQSPMAPPAAYRLLSRQDPSNFKNTESV
jgi:hypothetical protein